jgi:hypothetical protein
MYICEMELLTEFQIGNDQLFELHIESGITILAIYF